MTDVGDSGRSANGPFGNGALTYDAGKARVDGRATRAGPVQHLAISLANHVRFRISSNRQPPNSVLSS
jgi:hypothetical protein